MPRDIPISVPEKIRALIKEGWGDIASFADKSGFTYTEAYSMLVRTGARRALNLTKCIAEGLGISREEAAAIFFLDSEDERRAEFEKHAEKRGIMLVTLSEICWGNRRNIYSIISGKSSGKEVRKLVRLVNALGLDLDSFERLYDGTFIAA